MTGPAGPGRAPVAVLGLGNTLLTDEGVGVAAARQIAVLGLPGVQVLDGGTLGLALLPEVEGRRAVLILDAVTAAGRRPGDIVRLSGPALHRGWRRCVSAHQLGITDVLALADLAGQAPGQVAAIGMVPASLSLGCGLSAAAQRGLPGMVRAACWVLSSWGVPASPAGGSLAVPG